MSPLTATCINCGCNDHQACVGGCSWLGVNRCDGTGVCSSCPKSYSTWRVQQAEPAARQRRALLQENQPDLIQIGPTDI